MVMNYGRAKRESTFKTKIIRTEKNKLYYSYMQIIYIRKIFDII